MLQFKEISIEDGKRYENLLKNSGYLSCEYSFATAYMWCRAYDMLICDRDDVFMIMSRHEGSRSYLFPCGPEHAVKSVVDELISLHKSIEVPLLFYGVEPKAKEFLNQNYPEQFIYHEMRDNYDYIYNSTDLQTLAGKKYHQKRNHLKKFEQLDNWSFEEITEDNIPECLAMDEKWVQEKPEVDTTHETAGDREPIQRAFRHFEQLSLKGGLLRLNGEVVAFSFGEKMNDKVFVTHIEKAFSEIPGAYPMINREMAQRFATDVPYINREDDVGVEGLRKAKLSYHPAILLEKDTAEYIGG